MQNRIFLAFIFGLVLISGALYLNRQQVSQSSSVTPETHTKREYIAVVDSDRDGVPDWQDALLLEDPIVLASDTAATYTPPTTLTGKVGVSFIKHFLESKISGVFGASQEEIVARTIHDLKAEQKTTLFLPQDLLPREQTDVENLRQYGNEVAGVLLSAQTSSTSELLILQDALRTDDDSKLEALKPITEEYTRLILALGLIPVPSSYTDEHLALMNSLSFVRDDIIAFQTMNEDALKSLIALKRYHDDVLGVSNALTGLFDTLYFSDGVRWGVGENTVKLMTFE